MLILLPLIFICMLLLVATYINIYGNRKKSGVKKNIIAAYIHISGNNENHNNTFQRNVDIPWMGNVCKHCQSTFGLKATNIAMHIHMHGNKMRATNAVLRLRIRQPTLIKFRAV